MIPPVTTHAVTLGGVQSSASFEISIDDGARQLKRRQQAIWRAANPDKVKAYRKKRYAKDSAAQCARVKEWYRKNRAYALSASAARQLERFGLTLDDYKELLDAQGGACAICNHKPSKGDRRLAIDHSGLKVRGVLCMRCNVALGQFRDDPKLLDAAIKYLNKEPTRFTLPRPIQPNNQWAKRSGR